MPLFGFSLVLLFLLVPNDAFAWGIGVHLQLGSNILSNLEVLPPLLKTLRNNFV